MPRILDLNDGLDLDDGAPLPSASEVRQYLSGVVEWALSLLDALDEPTTDLEPQGDEEPSLGAAGSQNHLFGWQGPTSPGLDECEDGHDAEYVNEDGSEPHLP